MNTPSDRSTNSKNERFQANTRTNPKDDLLKMLAEQRVEESYVRPNSNLSLLSRKEIKALQEQGTKAHRLFRRCVLAILNTGAETDDGQALIDTYQDFDIHIGASPRGVRLYLKNAPESAFVDGVMIEGIRSHLSAVLRDIVFYETQTHDHSTSEAITDDVFSLLRNADAVKPRKKPNLVVCWGGHSISTYEYEFTKNVGYHLGLRELDIATGCGIGAMKGPMKGATIAHAKQKQYKRRYIGITEPGIIASEAPNPIVNELMILPDIEKRLETFVRLAHCIIVFPGGVGTLEEVLYLIAIQMHPDNKDRQIPVIFAADHDSTAYFELIDKFLVECFSKNVRQYYSIMIGDAEAIARKARQQISQIHKARRNRREAYSFNWLLHIPYELQQPFIPTHESMADLNLSSDQSPANLAINLRAAFSGIVAGNIKEESTRLISEKGPYTIQGDTQIMQQIDLLLTDFVKHKRMKLSGEYTPCYQLVTR